MRVYDGVTLDEAVRADVAAAIPAINDIKDEALRGKVIDAWAYSLVVNGFSRMADLPLKTDVGGVTVSDAEHTTGIVELSLCAWRTLKATARVPVDLDEDLLIAMAVCHDLGKTTEYNPDNKRRWADDPWAAGNPSSRHPFSGAYASLLIGLPDEVASACYNHSYTYDFSPLHEPLRDLLGGRMSFAAAIIAMMDMFYWKAVASAGK